MAQYPEPAPQPTATACRYPATGSRSRMSLREAASARIDESRKATQFDLLTGRATARIHWIQAGLQRVEGCPTSASEVIGKDAPGGDHGEPQHERQKSRGARLPGRNRRVAPFG